MPSNGPSRDDNEDDDENSPHDTPPFNPGEDGIPGVPSPSPGSKFGLDEQVHIRTDERPDEYQVCIDCPRLRDGTIKLTHERNYLTVLAEMEPETSFGEPYILHENIRLSENADFENGVYNHNNGVLTVTVPKKA